MDVIFVHVINCFPRCLEIFPETGLWHGHSSVTPLTILTTTTDATATVAHVAVYVENVIQLQLRSDATGGNNVEGRYYLKP